MSVIRPKPPEEPIEYARGGCFGGGGPLSRAGDSLLAALDTTRSLLLASADAAQPDRLLDAYNTVRARTASELFGVLQSARRMRDAVDRVIVLGDGVGALGGRAIYESCSHPFHNELSRGERGGRPRLSFAGDALEHDAIQGLLDLVVPAGRARSDDLLDQWGVIVGDTLDGGPGLTAATRLFLAALLDSVRGDPTQLVDRLIIVTTATGRLADLASAFGCTQVFTIPDDVGSGASVFTPLGLLPAAAAGIDVVRLLQGAAAMNRRCREAPVVDNPVLLHAFLTRLMVEQGKVVQVRPSHARQLDAVARWHDMLTGRTGVPEIVALAVAEPRRDPVAVPSMQAGAAEFDISGDPAGRSCPDLPVEKPDLPAAKPAPPSPAGSILLPRVDEHSIGQLLQFFVLAERLHTGFWPPAAGEWGQLGGDSSAMIPAPNDA